jgi:hypothetical protein
MLPERFYFCRQYFRGKISKRKIPQKALKPKKRKRLFQKNFYSSSKLPAFSNYAELYNGTNKKSIRQKKFFSQTDRKFHQKKSEIPCEKFQRKKKSKIPCAKFWQKKIENSARKISVKKNLKFRAQNFGGKKSKISCAKFQRKKIENSA